MERNHREKIIIVDNSISFTGGFKAIAQTAEDLNDCFEFIFIIPKGSSTRAYLQEKGIKTYEIKFAYLSKRIYSIITYFPYLILNTFNLFKILYKENVRIIHSNDLYNLSPVLLKFFYKRIILITHIRMLPASFPKMVYSFWRYFHEKAADKIIGVSEVSLITFKNKNKCVVIYDRIPIQEKYPYNYQEKGVLGSISLIYLSNYIPGKGQEHALESFKIAKEKLPTLKLTFAGSDLGMKKNKEYKEKLKQQAHQLHIEKDIEFKEFVNDIEAELKNHQILLNFSEIESFSFTVLESLFYGIPCIATASGGPQEILENGRYGILIFSHDTSFASNAIIKLAHDKELRTSLSKKGRVYVREKFSFQNTSKKLQAVYNDLLLKNAIDNE